MAGKGILFLLIISIFALNPFALKPSLFAPCFNPLKSKISLSRLIQSLISLKRRSLVEINSEVDGVKITLQSMLIAFVLRENKHNLAQYYSPEKLTA
jgi:hypothetical protein